MAITTTRVKGSLRNAFGQPYEGAVIKVYLASAMKYSDNIIGSELLSAYSDSYGKFYLDLVPSSADEENLDNYYVFEIIKETTQFYRKYVPQSASSVDFEDLVDYVPEGQRTLYIGRDASGKSTSEQIKVDLTGVFKWTIFDGDGSTKEFTAPGEIFIVSLNGLLILEGIDYTKSSFNVALLDEAPNSGDILGIQYKI